VNIKQCGSTMPVSDDYGWYRSVISTSGIARVYKKVARVYVARVARH